MEHEEFRIALLISCGTVVSVGVVSGRLDAGLRYIEEIRPDLEEFRAEPRKRERIQAEAHRLARFDHRRDGV